jgi:hypothetical protein
VEMQMSTTVRVVAPCPATQAHRPASQQSNRASFTEGAIILIALYTLLGAGIGAACGSLVMGMGLGLLIGVFAAAAILLIRGAAQGAKSV